MELTPEEKELAARIGFEEDVLGLVKQETLAFASVCNVEANATLVYYRGYQHGRLTKREQEPLEGLSIAMPVDIEPLALLLRRVLAGRGYLPFVFERRLDLGKSAEPGCMAVLKTKDQFDIVREGYTEGNDDYVDNDTIVAQLQEWHQRYGLEVIGANGDWLKVRFQVALADAAEIGAEAVALCPDVKNNW